MSRQVLAFSLLLGTGLLLSLLSWRGAASGAPAGAIPLAPLSADALTGLVVEHRGEVTTLTRRSDALGPFLEITRSRPSSAPSPLDEATELERFVSVEAGDRVLEQLLPLQALRSLEIDDPARLAALGLDPESRGTLSLEGRGGERFTFELGGRSHGSARRYLRDPRDGQVYLVDASPLRSLEEAHRYLVERALFSLRRAEIDRAELRAGDRALLAVHQGKLRPDGGWWSPPDAPGRRLEIWAAWLGKLQGLQALATLPAPPEGVTELFSLTVEGEGPPETLRLLEGPPGPEGRPEIYAHSAHLRAYVSLRASAAARVIDELPGVWAEAQGPRGP